MSVLKYKDPETGEFKVSRSVKVVNMGGGSGGGGAEICTLKLTFEAPGSGTVKYTSANQEFVTATIAMFATIEIQALKNTLIWCSGTTNGITAGIFGETVSTNTYIVINSGNVTIR